MEAVQAGETRTPMRTAFEAAPATMDARKRPDRNTRSLVGKVSRVLKSHAGIIRHKKMAYVTRPKMMFRERLVAR